MVRNEPEVEKKMELEPEFEKQKEKKQLQGERDTETARGEAVKERGCWGIEEAHRRIRKRVGRAQSVNLQRALLDWEWAKRNYFLLTELRKDLMLQESEDVSWFFVDARWILWKNFWISINIMHYIIHRWIKKPVLFCVSNIWWKYNDHVLKLLNTNQMWCVIPVCI